MMVWRGKSERGSVGYVKVELWLGENSWSPSELTVETSTGLRTAGKGYLVDIPESVSKEVGLTQMFVLLPKDARETAALGPVFAAIQIDGTLRLYPPAMDFPMVVSLSLKPGL